MSILTRLNYKKQLPPLDPFYQKPTDLYCHLCKNSGPIKRRKCLYQLAYHFWYAHSNECEKEWQKIIDDLYDLIKRGVIR